MLVASCQLIRKTSAAAVLLACGVCLAAEPATRPALQQLSEESRNLYDQVRHEVVRVQTPLPQWMAEIAQRENPLAKWGQVLDEQVRRQLAAQASGSSSQATMVEMGAAARGNDEPASRPSAHVIMGVPANREAAGFVPAGIGRITPRVNTMGLILDEQGHVLIPLYLEKEAARKGPIMLYGADGICEARFVGSDAKSNLTIVQMEKMIGRPAELENKRPEIGSLVMILTPNQSSAQLTVWTGSNLESGVVSTMDGRIAGIARFGHLISPDSCQSIARQLIEGGRVKRALLGVAISEVPADDPLRQSMPMLGIRPAIMVQKVLSGSPAEKAGIRPGDLILQLAGEDIEDPLSFATAIANRSGATTLEILRNGKVIEAQAQLAPE